MICDFAFPTHEIVGTHTTISHEEVAKYATAYAAMCWDMLSPEYRRAHFPTREKRIQHHIMQLKYAKGESFTTVDHLNRVIETSLQGGDWVTCSAHLKTWNLYKGMYPAEE